MLAASTCLAVNILKHLQSDVVQSLHSQTATVFFSSSSRDLHINTLVVYVFTCETKTLIPVSSTSLQQNHTVFTISFVTKDVCSLCHRRN